MSSKAHSVYVLKKQVSIRALNLWHFSPQSLGLFSVADELAVSFIVRKEHTSITDVIMRR